VKPAAAGFTSKRFAKLLADVQEAD
jgi:hypothetical protein